MFFLKGFFRVEPHRPCRLAYRYCLFSKGVGMEQYNHRRDRPTDMRRPVLISFACGTRRACTFSVFTTPHSHAIWSAAFPAVPWNGRYANFRREPVTGPSTALFYRIGTEMLFHNQTTNWQTPCMHIPRGSA